MLTILDRPSALEEVQSIRKQLGLSQEEIAFILGVTTTTLSRWATRKTLEPDLLHQDKIQTLVELLRDAAEVINPKAMAWWFKTPLAILNDLRPLDLLRSPSGFKKVKNLLFSMRWGLPV
jgi:putative toxin-antitoxin system antitoxin component (TIGR02293 family)